MLQTLLYALYEGFYSLWLVASGGKCVMYLEYRHILATIPFWAHRGNKKPRNKLSFAAVIKSFPMIIISSPQPEDAEGMNEVIKLSWYATYITPEIGITKEDIDYMYAQNEEKQIQTFRNRASSPKDNDVSLIAKNDRKVVGIIRLVNFADHIRVRTIYVHPNYVGKGIGTMLWNEARKHMPSNKPVIAYPAEHTKSINWYKKMGFVETGDKELQDETMAISGARLIGVKMILKQDKNLS
jgi:GNAT superfamily N-acetyltransferase